jgi:hypothetical protein
MRRSLPFVAVLVLALGACADSDTDGDVGDPLAVPDLIADPGELGSAVVGQGGAVLETDAGVTLVVPPGAVREDIRVVARLEVDPERRIRFEPVGQVFEVAVLVDLPGDDGAQIALRCFEADVEACIDSSGTYSYDPPWITRAGAAPVSDQAVDEGGVLAPGTVVDPATF